MIEFTRREKLLIVAWFQAAMEGNYAEWDEENSALFAKLGIPSVPERNGDPPLSVDGVIEPWGFMLWPPVR